SFRDRRRFAPPPFVKGRYFAQQSGMKGSSGNGAPCIFIFVAREKNSKTNSRKRLDALVAPLYNPSTPNSALASKFNSPRRES
ncbi:MAG: hypothetical protein L0338_04190, partial [Acidobacteria bacterium]|nr:hypothetical protein [Acidobacteriota bacterium]